MSDIVGVVGRHLRTVHSDVVPKPPLMLPEKPPISIGVTSRDYLVDIPV